MQTRFRTAATLSFALAAVSLVPHAFARAETKAEPRISADGRDKAVREQLLKLDGITREHVNDITRYSITPSKVAENILNDMKSFKPAIDVYATAQQTFYLKRGACNQLSRLFIALFDASMKEKGMPYRARLCEVYNNYAALTVQHIAVAVVDEKGNELFVANLTKKTLYETPRKVSIRILGENGPLSGYYSDLAVIEIAKENYAKAVEYARRAVELENDSAFANCVLGAALQYNGDNAGAERKFRRVIELAPGWPNGYSMLEFLLNGLGREKEADAISRIGMRFVAKGRTIKETVGRLFNETNFNAEQTQKYFKKK